MSTRRELLRLVGITGIAGLAGCLGSASEGPTPTPTPTPDGGRPGGDGGDGPGGSQPSQLETPPGSTHEVRIVAQDDAPDLPVVPRVELADPYATPGSPPVLKVTVSNPTDEDAVIGEYRSVVFQYVGSEDGQFVCLPHSERSTEGDPDRYTPEYPVEGDGCWRLSEHVAVTTEYGTVSVPAGGELVAYVGLYADPEAETCLPTGEHRVATTYSYFADGMSGEEEPEQAEWGFSFSLTEL